MLKKIAIGLLAVVAIVLGLATTKPNEFAVTRTITIKAPPDKIMPLIADFHNWAQWSYWETLDPKMVRTFEGPASGKGAVYGWKGDSKVGQGRMEVVEVQPASALIKLDFKDPVESNNMTEFTLTPEGDATKVTWNMKGPMPFISKIMAVFVDMDKMIGPDFEKGLAGMKAAAEKAPQV
ncbi:SRPBCC family protein [Massilia sp. CF038]|uniref:SRPBCC family protein n=1 Tax=Massilia sp. CF038 TaxID=1881045 RepID=UPI0009168B5D|nr:SRPBCC family protein [Massilia sp. CF038]SHG57574.1 Uncharacterized conserved protein YndB, AHSA1/START domain [Massilia sp. CF038]